MGYDITSPGDAYRDISYVKQQIASLARQLAAA
jgi:hypothetical protein